MHFPRWYDSRPPAECARLRLTYMLSQIALYRFGKASYAELARAIGCNRSTISNAIERGSVSEPMAAALEELAGRTFVQREWLINPLEAETADQK